MGEECFGGQFVGQHFKEGRYEYVYSEYGVAGEKVAQLSR